MYYQRYQNGETNNLGYAADFEEGYGDETEYNIESNANQMNFVSSRANYNPLRNKTRTNNNFIVREGVVGRGRRTDRRNGMNAGRNDLRIDVRKFDLYADVDADFGVANNDNAFDDQIPDEYKNDPELYRAI